MEFQPQKIDLGTPAPAMQYLEKKAGTDFRMNEHVQVHTGVDRLEQLHDDERVERRALEKLSEIQENAYREAYELGLDEGRKKAFDDAAVSIAEKLDHFEQLLSSLANMKTELLAHNETHLVSLAYGMASRLAGAHLENDNAAVVEVVRNAVAVAQAEEDIRLEMHPEQAAFIEELRKQGGREFEFLKKIRVEPNDKLQRGGCIVQTNYGEIDARVETRLQKLWESLADAMPKVKDRITG